jgi:cytochrome c6
MTSRRLGFIAAILLLASTTSFAFTVTPRIVKNAAMAAVCGWTLAISAAHAGDIAAGSKIFAGNCAACHAGGQNMIVQEKTLQKDALEKNLGSLDEEDIMSFVKNSLVHRGAFILGSKLSDKDFENVVSYVVDQAAGERW